MFLFFVAISGYVCLFLYGAHEWGVVWHKRLIATVSSELHEYLLLVWVEMRELGYAGLQICFGC